MANLRTAHRRTRTLIQNAFLQREDLMPGNENAGYDQAGDIKLKKLGSELVLRLRTLFRDDDAWKLFGDAAALN